MKSFFKKVGIFVVMFLLFGKGVVVTDSFAAKKGGTLTDLPCCNLNLIPDNYLAFLSPVCPNIKFQYYYDDTYHWLECTVCGATRSKAKHEYNYGGGAIVDGRAYGQCACGKKDSEQLPSSHTHFYDGIDGTSQCNACGKYTYAKTGFTHKNCGAPVLLKYNAHRHWYSCNKCNVVLVNADFHIYNGNSVCTICGAMSAAKSSKKCSKCGKNYHYRFHDKDHWLHCENCGTVSGSGKAHNFRDEGDKRICKECTYVLPMETCYVCKAKLKDKWLDNGAGSHYKECTNGHPSYITAHVFKDGVCTACGSGSKLTQTPQPTKCYVCQAGLKDKWLDNGAGSHYKECTNGHPSYISEHKWVAGVCLICFKRSEDTQTPQSTGCYVCSAGLKDMWLDNGAGSHYKECTNGHPSYITAHSYNKDGVCTVCGVKTTTTPQPTGCYVCSAGLKDKWLDNGAGSHYKECTNGHPSYITAHSYKDGVCTVCGSGSKSTTTPQPTQKPGSLFTDLPDDHWGYSDVKAMVDAGIVNGRGDGTLGTNDAITAEEVMALLSRIVKKKGLKSGVGFVYLEDKIDSWSHDEYASLLRVIGLKSSEFGVLGKKEVQLILGNTDEECIENYKKPLQREKVASLLGIFVEDGKENTNNVVLRAKDWGDINSIYRSRINDLAEKGILKGAKESDGIYVYPKQNVTRVEAISFINRLYKVL